MSRGLKNFNPGNIRISATKYLGEVQPSKDKAFKQFESMAWGYRAMFVLLHTYRKRGLITIRKMINTYAPPVENHTDTYIDTVAKRSAISADATLDTLSEAQMCPIVAAMSFVENGEKAVEEDVKKGWELFQKHKP